MKVRSYLFALLIGGCSLVNDPSSHQGGAADAGQPDAGPPRVEATEFCGRFARLHCDAFFSCCDTHPMRTAESYMACVEDAESDCAAAFGTIIIDHRTGYDPMVAAEVIEEGRGYVEMCDPNIVTWSWERSGYQRALTGTVDGGDLCTPHNTELNDNFDKPALFSCMGPSRACVPTGGDWSCLSRADRGGHCVLYWDCVDGLRCDWSNILSPMCAPRLATGMPCNADPECESLVCIDHTCRDRTQQNVYCGSDG
jgi:hypothetical protein